MYRWIQPLRMRTLALSLPARLMLAAALGIASGASCWLVIFRIELLSPASRYLPGAILGAFVWIHGCWVMRLPRPSLLRTCGLILVGALAWRLAQEIQALGGPFKWLLASLLGALGVGGGIWLAWPTSTVRLLLPMALGGMAGGLLFTLASALRVQRHEPVLWALLMLCAWHALLLTAATFSLHRARHHDAGLAVDRH